jgi:hypothetical protein
MENTDANKRKTGWLLPVGISFVVLIVVAVILFMMQGKTTIVGDTPGAEKSKAITCTIENAVYPFFEYTEADKKLTTVKVIFTKDNVDSISLTYRMSYEDEEALKRSEALNHSAMNNSFGSLLGPDALRVSYSTANKVFQMTLYATKSELNENSRKYFLMEAPLKGLNEYKTHFQTYGFECVEKTD